MSAKARPIALGTRITVATVGVLALVCLSTFALLASGERERRLDARREAAEGVADLYAQLLQAPLEFDDPKTAQAEIEPLLRTRDVTSAEVFVDADPAPIARAEKSGERGTLEVTRAIAGHDGAPLGRFHVVYSLAADEEAIKAARVRMLLTTVAAALAAALVLLAVVRRLVVGPLERLLAAAQAIARGDFSVRVKRERDDEVGELMSAYNEMARSLRDRDAKLAAATAHLRDLMDHMGQGLLAIGRDGRVVGEASREARALFGDALEGAPLAALLYPGRPDHDVEVAALGEWQPLAFEVSAGDWEECAELAPRLVTVKGRVLELAFRPVVREGAVDRWLVVARDVTRERELEAQVRTQEVDHARRLASMRRLLAGGAQIVVTFVQAARARLARVGELICAGGAALPSGSIDEAFQLVHLVKGEARACDFDELERHLHAFEDVLDRLRARAKSDGCALGMSEPEELLAEVRAAEGALERGVDVLAEISPVGRSIFEQVTVRACDLALLGRFVRTGEGDLAQIHARLAARPFGELAARTAEAAPEWAQANGKEVDLVVEGRDVGVPEEIARVLPAALAQLVRNALVHGVEPPDERARRGKPARGLVTIAARAVGGAVTVTVEDDGAGVDARALVAAALGAGLDAGALGASVDAGALGASSDAALEEAVFAPGVSARAAADMFAGRGMGLAAVRRDARAAGYEVSLAFAAGRFTRFTIAPLERRRARAAPCSEGWSLTHEP